MRFSIVAVSLIALFVFVGLGSGIMSANQGGQGKSIQKQITELQKERIETLRQAVDLLTTQYEAGAIGIMSLIVAYDDLFESQLSLAATKKERLTLLEKHLSLAKGLEQIAEQRFKGASVSRVDYLQTKATRLKCEIALLKESGG